MRLPDIKQAMTKHLYWADIKRLDVEVCTLHIPYKTIKSLLIEGAFCPFLWQTLSMKRISKPTLYLRSAYFIYHLKQMSSLRYTELEARIRVNQYERFGFFAPSEDTVRDYFRLHRSVAFEPNQKEKSYPWLLAAEMEFPGCSVAFFHPIFDLLFGSMESSAFWDAHFNKIPEDWTNEAIQRGWSELAGEWSMMNIARERRLHRSKKIPASHDLRFIHQSMLRIPAIRDILFTRQTKGQYARLYAEISVELTAFEALNPFEHITAILLCAKEAELIGNHNRFEAAHIDALKHLPLLKTRKSCLRIQPELSRHIVEFLDGIAVPQYSIRFIHGFSMPASWRSLYDESALKKIGKELLNQHLDTKK